MASPGPMSGPPVNLNTFNSELVRCLEDLRDRREEVNRVILAEEEEKAKIQKDISLLTDRLSKLNESLVRKVQGASPTTTTVASV